MSGHDDWERTTLGELVERSGGSIQTGPFGSQLHASDYVPQGVPSVMPANIGDNVINEDGIARITELDAERLARHRLRPGDIVYSRRGDVERRALVRTKNAGWLCGTGCLRVRFGDEFSIDSRFVSYLLGTPWTREWITQHAVGATMLNLNTAILGAVPLVVPSLLEQRAVADVLSALDDKIEANRKLAAAADDLASTEFNMAFQGASLSEMTFADVAAVGGGGTPRSKVPEYWGGDVQWLTPTDVTGLVGPYIRETSRTITEAGLASVSSPLYPVGSIAMTSRATIGAFAILDAPMAVNQGFIVVQPNDPSMRYWLFHEMRRRTREFLDHANGATFMELSRRNFKRLKVHLAARDVMAAFSAKAEALHDVARSALRENEHLSDLRDTLLPKLMSGQLSVEEAMEVAPL